MIQMFKVPHRIDQIRPQRFFPPDQYPSTRGHSLKLFVLRSNLDVRKNFFSQRVVKEWNSLHRNVVDAQSVEAFKHDLDKVWWDERFHLH